MKLIVVVWRDPSGSIVEEKFDPEKVKIRTEPGWLKLTNDADPIRIVPSDKVCLVQWVETQEEPRIVSPHAPLKGVPS